MKNKGLTWLLIVSLLASLFTSMPIMVNAASGSFGSDIKWEITADGMLAIGGSGEIPDSTAVGGAPWGMYDDEITSVYIKSGITSIGNYALSGLHGISKITLPDTVTNIGDFAFMDSKGIVELYLSKSLSTLGKGAFLGCNALTSVSISEENQYYTISDNCLFNKDKTTLILSLPGAAKNTIVIPEGVTAIDDYALCGNFMLGSVKIPASVKSIGNGVFSDCPALSTIYYKGSTNQWSEITIGAENGLIDNLITTNSIIYDYINATSLTLDVSELEMTVGSSKALNAQILPENASDKSIKWTSSDEDTVSVNQDGIITAHSEGTAIITATNHAENLSASCAVKAVYVPLSQMALDKTEIHLNVYESEKLNVILTPANASVGQIMWESSNYNVAWVDDNGTVTAANGGSAVITAKTSVGYEATCVVNVALTGTFGDGLKWAIVDDEESTTATNGGTLVISGEGEIPDYTFDMSDGSVAGGSTPTGGTAPWSQFYQRINSIVIEEGITSVGDFAFADCKYVYNITIPDSVTLIGNGAFAGVPYIHSFNVADTNTAFSSVDGNLFSKDKTTLIVKASRGEKIYQLPETVTEIAPYAFYSNNKTKNIILNKEIKGIGDYAFEYNSTDTYFYYLGTEEEWGNVVLGTGNDRLSNITCNMKYAEGMELNETHLELYSGNSAQLDAIFTPSDASIKDVMWSSSDTNIVYVDEYGKISANNAGIATITAISADGGFASKCSIAVTGSGWCGNNIQWTLTPDCETLTLNGADITYDYSYGGTQPWNSFNDKIKRVVVGENITALGEYLFTEMTNLLTVSLPESLDTISHDAFFECHNLVSLTIPDNVSQIGNSAFSNCSSLKNIKLPQGITLIDNNTFANCNRLTTLIIPDNITRINFGVFQGCEQLSTLVFGTNLTHISGYNFPSYMMTPVTVFYKGTETDWLNIAFEDSNERLQNASVIYCTEPATELTISETSASIWVGDTKQLYTEGTPKDSTYITYWSSSDETVATVSAEGNVTARSAGTAVITATTVDGLCSASCTVTAKNVPAEGMYIEENSVDLTRDKRYHLKVVFTPENTTNKKLSWTSSDENVVKVIENTGIILATGEGSATVTAVSEDGSFTDSCTVNVSEIIASGTLENGITWEIDFTKALRIEGSGAIPDFEDPKYSNQEDSTTGSSSGTAAGGSGGGIGSGGSTDGSDNSNRPENADKVAPWYFYSEDISYINIGKGITSVGDRAFNNCYQLNNVYMSNTVTTIGEYAFNNTNLQSINIPKNLKSIGKCAFAEIYNLSSIWVDPFNEHFRTIDNTLFDIDCTRLIKHVNGTNYYHVPETVKVIEPYAFFNNHALNQITLYDGLEEIGESAFYGCNSLTSVGLPYTLKKLGRSAFEMCRQLNNSVWIPENITEIPENAFRYCYDLQNVYMHSVKKIGAHAFENCHMLNNAELPDTLTEIGSYAFAQCSRLGNMNGTLTLPDRLVTIGDSAFEGCTGFNQLYLPEGLKKIGKRAFAYNSTTFDILIPASVTEIGTMAFVSEHTGEIHVSPDNTAYTSIDGVLFNKAKTDLICYPGGRNMGMPYIIPEGTVTIKEGAFARSNQHNIIIPNGVTTIEASAFREAYQLNSISIPDSVTSIGEQAFFNTNLSQLALPSGITEIPREMLSNCHNLCELTLGENIKTIANSAIYNCGNLNTVRISSALTNVGRYAFNGCPIGNVYYSGSDAEWEAIVFDNGNNSITDAPRFTDSKFVTGISLDKTELKLAINTEAQLKASIMPNDADNTMIEWTSLNPAVANVITGDNTDSMSNGSATITAMSGGSAIITARSMDGGYVAYCTVYVDEKGVCGENLTWNFSGDGTLTISGEGAMTDFFTANPDDPTAAAAPIPWSSIAPKVKRIVVEEGVTTICALAFQNMCEAETASIPSTVTSIGEDAFIMCRSLTGINVAKDNASYTSVDGVLFNKDKTVLICYPAGKNDTEYKIPDTVKEIGISAFRESMVETVIMNDGLERISDCAFNMCYKLSNLIIPSTVTSLGESAFSSLPMLRSVIYEEEREELDALLATDPTGVSMNTFATAFITCNSTMPINARLENLNSCEDELWAAVELESVIKPATAILALYDPQGALVATTNEPVRPNNNTAAASSFLHLNMKTDREYPGYTVKIFFWDIAAMQPMSNPIVSMVPTTEEWYNMYESAHNYANNTVEALQGFTYDRACVSIDVTFSPETDTERGQDFIYIYGENDTLIGKYSGTELAGKTINIPGNTFMIKLESDDMISAYGYRTERIVINKI